MIRTEREYRSFKIELRDQETTDDYKVRGYASTYEPYVLYEFKGIQYSEKIDREAFAGADMSDVIFLYNHEGMVHARMKNGTLKVKPDDHGLYIEADLSSTTQSRELFESIKAGLIDQMSFAFTVRSDEYDRQTHTRTITKFEKIFDVSAVSIPANPGTDISAVSARDYFNGVIEAEKAERLEEQRQLELQKKKFEFLEVSV